MTKLIVALLSLFLGAIGVGTTESVFLNFGTLVIATTGVALYLNQVLDLKKVLAMVVSWGTGAVLVAIAFFAQLGFIEGMIEWKVIVTGVGVCFAANGFYKAAQYILIALGVIKE